MGSTTTATQSTVAAGLPGQSIERGIRTVVKTSIAWLSDGAGAVTGNPVTFPSGTVFLVEFVPGTGGVAPTDSYDLTLLNSNGVNVFDDGAGTSIGANLSATVATRKVPLVSGASGALVRAWLDAGEHTLTIAAAGDSNQGTVTVYQCLDVL
jgi:hypothetical protein